MYNDMMDTIGLVEKADPELAAATRLWVVGDWV